MVRDKDTIKIVTFNIEYCASITKGYWQYITSVWKYLIPHNITTIDKLAKIINYEDVDLCTFLEIDGGSFRTMHMNYLNKLANKTMLKHQHFFPVRKVFGLTNQGNGILAKFPLLATENIKLPTHGENRFLSASKVQYKNTIITIFTTQLALGHMGRKREFEIIVDTINKTSGPVIFTGDLNTTNDKELEILNKTRLQRLETPSTFPSWKPKRRIDYVYYSPDFEVIGYKVLNELKVSDHLPIIAELGLKKRSYI